MLVSLVSLHIIPIARTRLFNNPPLPLSHCWHLNCLIFVKGCRTRRRPNNFFFHFESKAPSMNKCGYSRRNIYKYVCMYVHAYICIYICIYRKHMASVYIQKLRMGIGKTQIEFITNLLPKSIAKNRNNK